MSDTEIDTDSTDTTTDGDDWINTPDDGTDTDRDIDTDRQVVEHVHELDMDRLGIYREMNHRGGDETLVLLAAFPDGYGVFALDFAPDGQPLEMEPIGQVDEEEAAVSMAEYWCQQHPKGILGDDGGGGLLGMLGMGGE